MHTNRHEVLENRRIEVSKGSFVPLFPSLPFVNSRFRLVFICVHSCFVCLAGIGVRNRSCRHTECNALADSVGFTV